ncbi:MAG: ImmA/IrrE family metallo-endopeptidase [Eubacteriales bacterium]|nr:ImmA/IrrE family metallo-endopeptidase [Eubacteriales bacterium]
MTTSPDYRIATNMAYQTLSQCKNFSLPIRIKGIVRIYPDVKILSYSKADSKYGLSSDMLMEQSEHGFTMLKRGRRIILYNEKKDIETKRFTVAHELGHCVLEHAKDDDTSNKEANCFARNILCPIPVVKELQIETEDDYAGFFAVSEPMASASINLANSDFNYIDRNLYDRMRDLLMCYMTGYTLAELYGYP